MATIKNEETGVKKTIPVLKKRTAPEDVVVSDPNLEVTETQKPLPGNEPQTNGLPPRKKRTNPLKPEQETVTTEETKEKTSLEQMKERIAAQKRLEQEMMTQETMRNKERGVLRGKINALLREQEEVEDEEEIVETQQKPVFDTDLKTEALEMQNKKLKNDLEKIKKQIQTLFALEFNNVRVIDSDSLELSEDFITTLGNEASPTNISELEEQLKLRQDELTAIQLEIKQLTEKYELQIKELNKEIKKNTKEIEKLKEAKETLTVDKQNLQSENKKLSEQVNSLLEQLNISTQENKNKELLNSEINTLKEKVEQLEVLESQIIEKNNKITELEQEIVKLQSSNSNEEELVKQQEQFKEQTEQLNNEHQLELSKKTQEIEQLQSELQKVQENNNIILQEKENLQSEVESQKLKIQELEKQVQELLSKEEPEQSNEGLPRIKPTDDLTQKDYAKMNTLESEIKDLKRRVKDNEQTIAELDELYQRFIASEKQMISKFKDVRKYVELVKQFGIVKSEAEKLSNELEQLNIKENKKAYKAKAAEVKSMNYKVTYLEKSIKRIQKKKRVIEYLKIANKIKEFDEQFSIYNKRNAELNLLITEKEILLEQLKG